MTSDEADQRILLSRATFEKYVAMIRFGDWPMDDLPLFRDEVAILEGIAGEHPLQAKKLEGLINAWTFMLSEGEGRLN
jgi:hypothetical protein